MCRILATCLAFLSLTTALCASDHLLYFEAQGIGGYSTEQKKAIYYSQNPDAEMQKPSVGFDYLQRFSGETGDWASFALQGRFAVTVNGTNGADSYQLEPQVYNAYFKVKTPDGGPYVWAGHNRPAFGLGSYLDSHALLLRTLAIQGFGYDRDWGVGLYKDFSWGDISATQTTGSGMPVYTKGNNMSAARISYGVLSRDNYNVGFSLGYGRTLDTMGYKLLQPDPENMRLVGVDAAFLWNRFEHRFDLLGGEWLGQNTYAGLYRFGINLDQENRYKLEFQPAWWKYGDERNFQGSVCFSSLVTSSLTLRVMYTYNDNPSDNRVVFQFYYYTPI